MLKRNAEDSDTTVVTAAGELKLAIFDRSPGEPVDICDVRISVISAEQEDQSYTHEVSTSRTCCALASAPTVYIPIDPPSVPTARTVFPSCSTKSTAVAL